MKLSRIIFACWVGIMALAITLSVVPTFAQLQATTNPDELASPKTEEPSNHHGRIDRFLAGTPRPAKMTCDRYPTVCRTKGRPGPDCCNKQCVNLMTDKQNCGTCGKRCSYSQLCCKGRCANPSADDYHCGRCNNPCEKGSSCVYGLCSYAD
ncbi:hypothetical protein PTKIN_Ptkin18bG0147800 [Pterospermum kingtungense]